jgi:hypothetical protein
MSEVEHTLAFGCCKFHGQSYGNRQYGSISLNGQRIFKLELIDLIRLRDVVERAVDYTCPTLKVKTKWFYITGCNVWENSGYSVWARKPSSHSPVVIGIGHHERVSFSERKYLEAFMVFLQTFLGNISRSSK